MARTKQVELAALAEMINKRLGIEDPDQRYTIGRANGSPRLHRALESVDVSPRLPAGPLGDWLRAFLDGIDVGVMYGQTSWDTAETTSGEVPYSVRLRAAEEQEGRTLHSVAEGEAAVAKQTS